MLADTHSVLVVTKDSKISSMTGAFLAAPLFEARQVSDFNEARRLLTERFYDIVFVDYADGEGADFATDISDSLSTILLLTPQTRYEEISYRVEGYGIITVATPMDQFLFYSTLKTAIAVQYKVQQLQSQTTKLKNKMEEIRIVNRAKLLLLQVLKMTETEAHHYIEKEAMDRGLKKTAVAEEIIRTYG